MTGKTVPFAYHAARRLPLRLFAVLALALLATMALPAITARSAPIIFTVNSTLDQGDANPADGVCETAPGSGICTLRAAIQQSNANLGTDTVAFAIGSGLQTIAPDSQLPIVADPVIIDGTTQPGYAGKPLIQLDGINAGVGSGLTIDGGSSTLKGLIVNRFMGHGIQLRSNGGNTIQGNFIGTNSDGLLSDPNTMVDGDEYGNREAGVYVNNTPNNTIGGTDSDNDSDGSINEDWADGVDNDGDTAIDEDGLDEGNLISGSGRGQSTNVNGHGVWIYGAAATGNVVAGNLIGTDLREFKPGFGNSTANEKDGVFIDGAPSNTVGGTAAGQRNVISNNDGSGVEIKGAGATGNVVEGNFIGTNGGNDDAIGNLSGVFINDAPNNIVGGTDVGARNILSGNTYGVQIKELGATGNVVEGNYIGVDSSGATALSNDWHGVFISGSSGNTIGGTTAAARNVISGNLRYGVRVQNAGADPAENNLVQGNFIGTNAAGSAALPNGTIILPGAGVGLSGVSNNTIGGTAAGAGNVISGNINYGIEIRVNTATGNTVQGNFVGTNAGGDGAIPNRWDGIIINDSPGNTIGGTAAGARNVISGNGNFFVAAGVYIFDNDATGNVVQGNYIGSSQNGAADLGNFGDGVFIDRAPGNTIGGTTAAARNVLSGNGGRGVQIAGAGASGNLVRGNYIGTDASGALDLGNTGDGVFISGAPGNSVGGTAAGARNVISGNDQEGVQIYDTAATGNLVQGNYIGTDQTGTTGLGNALDGVFINGSPNSTIGGTTAAARNVISDNYIGVNISGSFSTGNLVRGNYIGTDVAGTANLGNLFDGVRITGSASSNSVGGTASSAGNKIHYNGGNGVRIDSGVGNAVLANSVHSNTELGIDLAFDGADTNDPGDGDSGPNNKQNYPVVTAAQSGSTYVQGTLNSTANTNFRLEFFSNPACDASGKGEGKTFLGATSATTNGSGNASFAAVFSTTAPLGEWATATATDPSNSTSEFSACTQVTVATDTDGDGALNPSDNCPAIANANQADGDGDGVGNVCDNCPLTANPDQADTDGDGLGNACDDAGDLDFNGDGNDDAWNYYSPAGTWWVLGSSGTAFTPTRWATGYSPATGWSPQLVGDFNGDGKADIANYNSGTGVWRVNVSTGAVFSVQDWATFSTKTGWSAQQVGDFNGDGLDDIVNYHAGSGNWWVNVSTGSSFTPQKWATFKTKTGWSPQLVGDFNGDGKDDVVNYHAGSGNWWVNVSTGPSFTPQKWATFSTKTGWSAQQVGDFNGDGKDDVVNYHAGSGTWWVNRSTSSSFTPQKWATFSTKTGWSPQLVGDFNGDGKDDVVNYHAGSGTWWVNRSTGAGFVPALWTTFSTKTGWSNQVVADYNGDGMADVVNYHASSGNWSVNLSTGAAFTPTLFATFTISLLARSTRVRQAAWVSHALAPREAQRQKGDRHEP